MTTYRKDDAGKPRMSLIPPEALLAVARVLTYGAERYGPDNWHRCDDPTRYLDAALRHLAQWQTGPREDADTGESHLAHAMCSIAFLYVLTLGDDA